jgi:MSHA biogenesis protein MshP
VEWGIYKVVDPTNAINIGAGSCAVPPQTDCPTSPSPSLGGSLSGFTVTVTCTLSADTTEGNRNVRVFQIVAEACNQPSGGACPNANPAHGYVARRLEATVSKCKDSSATLPRCSCG